MVTIPKISDKSLSVNWKDKPCSRLDLPLFNPEHPDKVHFSDVIQGEIGSCWFLSVLISYLRPNSKNISQRAKDIHDCIKVYREDPDRTIYKIRLNGRKVLVDDYIPNFYHKNKDLHSCKIKCKWFIMFEKAMLSLMTFYKDPKKEVSSTDGDLIYVKDINIKNGEMKAATIGIGYLISGRNRYYCLHKKDVSGYLSHITAQELYIRFKAGDHIMANTSRFTYPGKKYPFSGSVDRAGGISSHCYAIINMEYSKEQGTYLLTIQNPWGDKELAENGSNYVYPPGSEKGKGLSIITWERFWHLFACVHLTE